MSALSQKVALVTGASSGIGRAAALLFAREGAQVILGARNGAALDRLVSEITGSGGTACALAGDVQDERYAAALVNLAQQRFGRLDVAFNNAGTLGDLGPLPELSLAAWHHTLDTNLTAAFLAAKHQVPALLAAGGGSLIFTSSFVGHTVGMPGMAAYAAAKAGLLGLVRSLAAELGPQAVRVNALLPGGTDTPMAQAIVSDPAQRTFIEGLHALKRLADPEEIAKVALFLASEASSFVTGTALLADGGVSITRT
ncbi:SDR family oxidoreductase [Caldimonas brevitalea]|uniref:Short-chain dehydrogenase n=1 Tax=Caldimonas brevitalea TaxID=413882 RepID=A0A0G3BZ86_9BURK|nr:SDR family oxidoreductase [Caldimonas brevitalea]AKJ31805.1 short-chain dehydrogenase [Caldimonas brevitalea]